MHYHRFGKGSQKELDGIHPLYNYLALQVLARSKYDIGIPTGTGGFRTATGQLILFNRGNSKCDGVKELSTHQLGLGLDFVVYIDGEIVWPDTHPVEYLYVATLFLEEFLRLKVLAHHTPLTIPPNTVAATLHSGASFHDLGHLELRGIPPWRELE